MLWKFCTSLIVSQTIPSLHFLQCPFLVSWALNKETNWRLHKITQVFRGLYNAKTCLLTFSKLRRRREKNMSMNTTTIRTKTTSSLPAPASPGMIILVSLTFAYKERCMQLYNLTYMMTVACYIHTQNLIVYIHCTRLTEVLQCIL